MGAIVRVAVLCSVLTFMGGDYRIMNGCMSFMSG
jgi:hypothetical protein